MTTATQEKTLESYLQELGVSMTATLTDYPKSAPKWAIEGEANAYRVTLTYAGKKTSLYFYCGRGKQRPLSVADVVADLSRNYDTSVCTLQEFGDEFGWDSETIKTYQAVKRIAERFRKLFSNDEIRQEVAELASEY